MRKNITLGNFTEKFIKDIADSDSIFERGKRYFQEGRVINVYTKGSIISAKVRGSSLYNVEIDFSLDDNLETEDEEYYSSDPGIKCSCPYGGYGCKHSVAVLYYLLNKMGKTRDGETSKIKEDIKNIFKNYSTKDMLKFAKLDKLLIALNYVNGKKIKIKSQSKNSLNIELDADKKYYISLFITFFGSKSHFMESCSCNKAYNDHVCEHILAARILLLKNSQPNFVLRDFEDMVRKKIEKDNYERFVENLNIKSLPEKRKNIYRLFYTIKKNS